MQLNIPLTQVSLHVCVDDIFSYMRITIKNLRKLLREAVSPDACEDCLGSGKAYVGLSGRDTGALCGTCNGSGKKKTPVAGSTNKHPLAAGSLQNAGDYFNFRFSKKAFKVNGTPWPALETDDGRAVACVDPTTGKFHQVNDGQVGVEIKNEDLDDWLQITKERLENNRPQGWSHV